jgi:hydroxymethylglutaryl-CoA lyase
MSQSDFTIELPRKVRITEVGPRDGLQNEARILSTAAKVELIHLLARAGIQEMEVTSFVNPRLVPALADAEEVMLEIGGLDLRKICLVLNERGYDRAVAARADMVTMVISATEAHNRSNANRSRDESMTMMGELQRRAQQDGIATRLAISVAFGCPFEGLTQWESLLRLLERAVEHNFTRIGLCDTMGAAHPQQVYEWTKAAQARFPAVEWELHLHDTYGRGLANVYAGWLAGIERFDASIGGLGGCPFAPGATGNIATEDIVSMLDAMGVSTDVDLSALLSSANFLQQNLPGSVVSNRWRVSQSQCAAEGGENERV